MGKPVIRFSSGDIGFVLRNKTRTADWLVLVARRLKRRIGTLDYVFVSDKFLLQMNREFLQHDTYTDIITFDYSKDEKVRGTVSGEVYISLERVTENAATFGVSRKEELDRVMAHGLLHLCGFRDKTPAEQKRMRKEEENAIALRK